MINIFVANLDFGITSDDLRTTFSQFGEVSYAHVVYDNKTKKSKGYGYVEMEDIEEVKAAIDALNGMEIEGRALDIKIAIPKDKRQKSSSTGKSSSKFAQKRKFVPKEVKDAPPKVRRVLRPRRKRKED